MRHSSLPKYAVLLAACNGSQWIDAQLDTILGQDAVDVTVFVSVDLSSDGTEACVRRRSALDARIIFLPTGKTFGCAAKNFYRLLRDVDLTGFDYLAFADQDDLWHEDKLARACDKLMQGYSAYSSNVTAFWTDGRKKLIQKAQPQRQYDFLFEAAGPGCTYVFARSFFEVLQNVAILRQAEMEEVFLHDWLFYALARSGGYRWYIDPEPGLLYRQHQINQVGANFGLRAWAKRMKMIVSRWYRAEVVKIACLCQMSYESFSTPVADGPKSAQRFVLHHIGCCRRYWRDRLVLYVSCLLGLF
nr:glycosyltransferase [uncultured Desulfuromonas sp.]